MPLLDLSETKLDPKNIRASLRRNPQCTSAGKCELRLEAANYKEGGQNGPYYIATFIVTAHEDPKAVGQEFVQFLNLSGKWVKQAAQVALVTGATTEEKLTKAILQGTNGVNGLDLTDGLGKTLYGEIKSSKNKTTGDLNYKIWDFWGPDDPESEGFPKSSKSAGGTPPEVSGVPVIDRTAADPSPVSEDEIPF